MLLLCVDLSNLLFHYRDALRHDERFDRRTRPAAAVVATLRHISALLAARSPAHVALALDTATSTARRRAIWAGYKGGRSRTPNGALRATFQLAAQAVHVLRWPVISHRRWEADDCMASAAHTYPGSVLLVSGDKDMLALCSDRVRLQLLVKGRHVRATIGPDGCRRILGVRPDQVPDLKALAGDWSDHIRPVGGVKLPTAAALLSKYDTLAAVYEHLETECPAELTSHRAQRILQDRDLAMRSSRLTALRTHLPIDVSALSADTMLTFDDVAHELRELGLGGLFEPVHHRRRPRPRRGTHGRRRRARAAAS